MLIGYSMPPVTAIAIAGATWLTADGGAACYDGKPARRARASGTPVITLTFGAAFIPRVIAVLGLVGVAVGATITATTGAGATLGGNSATGSAVRFADGSIGAWIVTGDTVSTATVKIAIGATGVIDIGELVAMPAVEVRIDAGWTQHLADPTEATTTRGAQINAVPMTPWRELACTFSLAAENVVRFAALAAGMDWERLAIALAGKRRCVAISRWETVAGSGIVSPAKLTAHAMYGIASEIGESAHQRGPWWNKAMRFREIPAG